MNYLFDVCFILICFTADTFGILLRTLMLMSINSFYLFAIHLNVYRVDELIQGENFITTMGLCNIAYDTITLYLPT